MTTNKLFLFLSLIVGIALVSCDANRVFDDYIEVGQSGWNKDSSAVFNVQIDDIQNPYNIYIKVRNTSNYSNSNLWLFFDAIAPNGASQRDTLECILADRQGKWYGSGWGSTYHMNLLYKKGIKFKDSGLYSFRITQGMRADILSGIKDVGLRIESAED